MASQPQTDEALPVIHFKDAVGRKFTFPYEMVREWQGMKELIDNAFQQVDVLGPHVKSGHFDLLGPRGEIILPAAWHLLIQPGMSIVMTMWPMDKPPRALGIPPPPRMPPPGVPRPQGITVPMPPPNSNMPQNHGPITSNLVPVVSAKKSKPKGSAMLTFLAGKPANKRKPSKFTARPGGQTSPERPPSMMGVRPDRQGIGGQPPPPAFAFAPPQAPFDPRTTGAFPPPAPGMRRPGRFRGSNPTASESGSDSVTEVSDESEDSDGAASIKSRSVARKAGLIVHIRQQTDQRKIPRRQLTLPILEPSPAPMERSEFSSARIYPDELGPGSVAIELTKHNNPPGGIPSTGEGERINWLHVSRTIMDFSEFENIALQGGNLTTSSDSRLAMESIFKVIYDKRLKRSRENWFVEPGTVLRCDVDSGGKTVASVVFASVPQIQVDTFNRGFNVKFRKGVCVPRRLHEAFNPYDTSFGRDKNQFFRKQDGAAADEVLWVCETWVLIVDSGQVFTYGDPRRRLALQENIEIREHFVKPSDDKTVHVTTPEHLQFQIALKFCETFFKLQSSVAEQLTAVRLRLDMDLDDVRGSDDFQLFDAEGEALTAKSWSKLAKQTRQNVVHVRVEWVHGDDSSSSVGTVVSSDIYSDHDHDSTSRVGNVVDRGDEGEDFFGIRKVSTQESEATIVLPDLHAKVPPFLGWSILEANTSPEDNNRSGRNSTSDSDQKESILACLLRTETALIERHHPHVADLQSRFLNLNFNATVVRVGVENIEMQIQTLSTSRRRPNRSQSSNFDDGELSQIYRDYLSISIRTLEAFAPKGHESPVLSLYYDALSKGAQYLKTQDVVDRPQRWVISREPIPIPGLKYQYATSTHVECDRCERGTIYNTPEDAMDHLRGKHFSETTSEARLREYLLSLSVAADVRLKKEFTDLLTTSRDAMLEIVKQARDIQDGVVFDDRFRQPAQGVPYALLKSLQLIIAFVCTVPLLLEAMHSYYRHDVHEDGVKDLTLGTDQQEKSRFLKTTGSEIANLMKTAERALIASEESRKREDVVKFFSSVGAHGLGMQMVSNMLQQPVYNNSNAAELFVGYQDNFASQVFRRPSKRHIPLILAMMDELARLVQVTKWQRKALRSLQTVLRPSTHLEPLESVREKTFNIERFMIDEAAEKLEEQLEIFKSKIERGRQLIELVEGITEITKDDQNRAIFVFTVVTVIFLPLSFVATYMSMNGGPSNQDWVKTQVLFWQISAPLAVVIGVFCVWVAWQGHVQALGRWMNPAVERVRLFFWPSSGKDGRSDSSSEGGATLNDD